MNIKQRIPIGLTQQTIAADVGQPQQVVSRWVNRKVRIPSERVIAFCKALKWRITPHEIRPDIYPNPTDGLPPGVTVPPPAEQRAEQ